MDKKLDLLIEDNLYKAINEERGISSTVSSWAILIIGVIRTKIILARPLPINRDFVTFKSGETNINLGTINIPIKWYYYNFMDEKTKDDNKDLLTKHVNGLNKYGLSIVVYSVNNIIDADSLENTLGHELLHLFQTVKSHKAFSNTELYRMENEWKNSTNPYLSIFGNILYLSNKFEQDDYNHGLYMSLISCKWYDELFKALQNDQTYYILQYLINSLNKLTNVHKNDQNLDIALNIIKEYRYNLSKIIKIGNKTIERLNHILARTYVKAEKDWKKRNMISEKADYRNSTPLMENTFHNLDKLLSELNY